MQRRSRLLTPIRRAPRRALAKAPPRRDLHERVEAELERQSLKAHDLGVRKGGHDQQNRVGATDPGLADLIGVDDEVLAEGREEGP